MCQTLLHLNTKEQLDGLGQIDFTQTELGDARFHLSPLSPLIFTSNAQKWITVRNY